MLNSAMSQYLASQQFLKPFIADLEELLEAHGPKLAAKGREYITRVRNHFNIDFEKRSLIAHVEGDEVKPYVVELTWESRPKPNEPYTDVVCSCPWSNESDLCKHTWAALSIILMHLRQPRSQLSMQLSGAIKPDGWKKSLTQLDNFIRSVQQSAPPAGPAEDSSAEDSWRLTYRMDVDAGRNLLCIMLSEQNRLKNGTWSKGRKMTWGRFVNEKPAQLSSIDANIWEIAKREMTRRAGYGSYSNEFIDSSVIPSTWVLLTALRGHEFLFHGDDTSTPLEIVDAKPELILEHDKGDLLALVPGVAGRKQSSFNMFATDGRRGFICCDWTRHKVFLCAAETPVQSLFQQLLKQRMTVPKEGVTELLERLTAMEQALKVTYPPELEGETVPAESHAVLRLSPRVSDGGVNVEIWSKPEAKGPYFEPGAGLAEIVSYSTGVRRAAIRNLELEKSSAEACRSALQLDRFNSSRPWHWTLPGGDEALDFLGELQQRTSDAWTVEWSNSAVPRPDVVGEIKASDLKLEIKTDHDWFGMEGMFDIGGEKVPLVKILDALRKNSKYIQLDGGKWARLAQEFRERLESLADLLHRNQSKLHFDATAAPMLQDLLKDQMIEIKAVTEWRKALQRLERARNHNPEVPVDLKANLRDYQVEGYKWLSRLAAWGVGGCLADDMGLGKTVQALAILLERQKEGPALVIAPVSVGFNWVNEITRFTPTLRPHLYRDTERGDFLDSVGPGDVVVASYGLLLRDSEHVTNVKWGTLVLDEAQFIKNSRTKTAQVVREIQAGWRLTLTGTPVENQLADLWSLFRATTPGLFGSWERFRERFADPIEKQNLPERKLALARTVRPFILRRTKEDVLKELPDRTEVILNAELSSNERKLYEDARLFAIAQLAGIDTGKTEARFQVLALLTRLRQLACHPKLVDDQWAESSAKMDLLLETVEEIREGKHRALIFSQFTSHLALIRQALDERNISYMYLDGQTPAKQRRARVEAFQEGKGDLFLISLKAGGTGLNLTGADYVIHMDPWWNPAVEDQATDRAHRIGQTKAVMVYRLVAKDTIEEKILAMHEKKRNLVSSIMDGSDQAGKLSTNELIDLIKGSSQPEMPAKDGTAPVKKRGRAKKAT
ncbi:MAG: ATP-dependent helicase HepA [Planctomycetaceae bacterium]|nr:ATP-dependent helicase HepA [Planctomycetaceae bacterium]